MKKWKITYKIKGENQVRTEIVDLAAQGKVKAGAAWKTKRETEDLEKYEFINAVPFKEEKQNV